MENEDFPEPIQEKKPDNFSYVINHPPKYALPPYQHPKFATLSLIEQVQVMCSYHDLIANNITRETKYRYRDFKYPEPIKCQPDTLQVSIESFKCQPEPIEDSIKVQEYPIQDFAEPKEVFKRATRKNLRKVHLGIRSDEVDNSKRSNEEEKVKEKEVENNEKSSTETVSTNGSHHEKATDGYEKPSPQ
ncbi:uncharacterized protein LOC123685467 isoform X2 [Harmonia axyridis]|uniref:uncharacterized protein LOC123685467 isoform X2 n=1 Tax=Harmonia axyridis TaxID=115357 RepID=UPI001E2784A2|nr:uncharacterized protein LOC123685467 isoform X2 [Harmonia axyridis]